MLPEAISEFERAAEILRKQNRVDDYIKVAERLVYHDQTRLDVIKELARLYLDRSDAKRGLAKLQICFKAQPRDIEVLEMLSQAFTSLGQHQKTIFVYKELARVHQDEGRVADATEVLQKILQLDPNDADARSMMGGSSEPTLPPNPVTPAFMTPSLSPPPVSAPTPAPMLAPSLAPRPPSMAPSISGNDWSVPSQPGYPFGTSPAPALDSRPPPPRPPSLAPRPPPPPIDDDPRTKTLRPPGRDNAQISKVLTETDVYIKYGLREKALSHLRRVFEIDPDNVDAYAKMRDIYRSMGDQARAAEAIANMMHVHNRRGEIGQLEAARAELAKLVPGHPLASGGIPGSLPGPMEVSDEFSVDIEEGADSADVLELVEEVRSEPALRLPHIEPPPEDDEPLEVDRSGGIIIRSDDLLDSSTDRGGRPLISDLEAPTLLPDEDLPEASSGLIMLSEVETGAELDESRPSFALEEDDDDEEIELPSRHAENDPFEGNERSEITARSSIEEARREVTDRSHIKDVAGRPPTAIRREVTLRQELPFDSDAGEPAGADSLDLIGDIAQAAEDALGADDGAANDELDEAEFLIEAGLAEEARGAVESILERFPTHARALEMMERVRELEREAEADTDHEVDEDAENTSPSEEPELPLDSLPLPPDDGTTPEDRYDQGMLFKEIGRLDDAIREFRGAARHPARLLQSLEMIGHCLMEKGAPRDAIAYFARALDRGADGISATNLKYEIGNAYEVDGDQDGALEWFTACHRDDPDHRDVSERLERFGGRNKKGNGVPSESPRASSSKKSKITYL
jgi:tetratricopeptide (TPR) repeat protein